MDPSGNNFPQFFSSAALSDSLELRVALESALTMMSDVIPREVMRSIRRSNDPLEELSRMAREYMPAMQRDVLPRLQRRLQDDPPSSLEEAITLLKGFASSSLSSTQGPFRPKSAFQSTRMEFAGVAVSPLPRMAESFQDAMGPLAMWMGDGPPMDLVFSYNTNGPYYLGTTLANAVDPVHQELNDPRCEQELYGCPDKGCEADGGKCYRRGKVGEDGKFHIGCDCSADGLTLAALPYGDLPEVVVIADVPGSGCKTLPPGGGFVTYHCTNVYCDGTCFQSRSITTTPDAKVITISCDCDHRPPQPPTVVPVLPPEVVLALIIALILALLGIWGLGLILKAGVMAKAGMSAAAILAAIGISSGR